VVDPADTAQNTWYVCVWSGWGGAAAGKGGLYRTRDRGLNWSRLNSRDRVSSCALNPANTNELYFTTETEGLWISTNIQKTAPAFSVVTNYPFRQPERVFFNPYVPTEIWVTSFGNGLRMGRIPVVAEPVFVPAGGTSATPVTVTISCATTGAVIRYTVDGTEPTADSPAGTNVWIGDETLLRARAFLPDWNDSPIHSAAYGCTDTDGDRLPNWVETGTYVYQSLTNTGTLAGDPDTDDDGRNDYVEAHQGTDPFSPSSFPRVPYDFDGDGMADICLRRAANGKIWALHSSSNAVWPSAAGVTSWIAASADYDGDGKMDPSWFIPSTTVWRIYPSTSNYAERLPRVTIGGANDIPVPADFDGDGKADIAVFRRVNGRIRYRESGANYTNQWTSSIGQANWLPTPADYDGDGKADFSWFIPATQAWRIYPSSSNYAERLPRVTIGGPDDIPLAGADFDGDGKADLAVFQRTNGKLWARYSSLSYANRVMTAAGSSSWLPTPGDYDGDGKADYSWFIPSTKTWRVYESSRGYQERARVVLGDTSDWPLATPLLGW
jgi:hypothetical protein